MQFSTLKTHTHTLRRETEVYSAVMEEREKQLTLHNTLSLCLTASSHCTELDLTQAKSTACTFVLHGM